MDFGNQRGSKYAPLAVALRAITAAIGFASCALACEDHFATEHRWSWVFARSTYTHDPLTGARVAQYMRMPGVEDLDDPRAITSRYRRTQTVLRGRDGSNDTYYQVQAWGNGLGGIDAEWERFHEAWKESILSGGYYSSSPSGWYGAGPGYFGGGYGSGYGYGPGYGGPGYGGQHYGLPNYGGPAYGGPRYDFDHQPRLDRRQNPTRWQD